MTSRRERIALWTILLALLALNFAPTFAARNGAGTYTIPNVFSPGDTITASSHNQNFSDIAAELTNSVAADGQTSMTGPLKAAAGSVSAPSLTFASDTDTGLYRSAANTITASAGGAQIATIDSNGVSAVSGNVNAVTGKLMEAGAALMPAGVVLPYSGSSDTPPTGFLFAYGQCVSQTTYADLYAALGATYDNSCGAGTFGIPDLRGRAVAGQDDMGGVSANRLTNQTGGLNGDTLGATGGAETHTLTTAQMPAHTHTGTTDGHTHSVKFFLGAVQSGGGTVVSSIGVAGPVNGTDAAVSATDTFTSDLTGGGGAHNNVQPTIVLNYIIKH